MFAENLVPLLGKKPVSFEEYIPLCCSVFIPGSLSCVVCSGVFTCLTGNCLVQPGVIIWGGNNNSQGYQLVRFERKTIKTGNTFAFHCSEICTKQFYGSLVFQSDIGVSPPSRNLHIETLDENSYFTLKFSK